LVSLVSNGTITTDQQEQFLYTLRETLAAMQTQYNEETDPLDALVDDGTITEEQQNTVNSAFETAIKAYNTQSYSSYSNLFWNTYDLSTNSAK
jgi:hypothetical protein